MEEGALAVPPGNLTFVLSADSGDYMFGRIEYGDLSTETVNIRFHNNMPNITHYYTLPGRLDVYFDLYCAYNLQNVNLEIYVVYPINNTTVFLTHVLVGETNYVDLWLDDGTDVNVTILWGDGDITHELEGNYTNVTTTVPHTYASAVPGTWNVMMYISNALSEHVYNMTLGTDLHILNLVVTVSATIITSGTTSTFSRTLTQGTQLHCSVDFGDGNTDQSYVETSPTSVDIDHVYSAPGDYHYNYTCWNHLDNATHLGTIFLNEAITGVVPSVVDGGAYALVADFNVTWTFSTGEPAYFNASFGSVKGNDTTVTYDPKEGSATFYAGTLEPGEYLFKLTAENALTPWTDEFEISLDRQIAGHTFALELIDPDYVAVGRATGVTVGQSEGSRVTDTVLLDGVAYYASFVNLTGGVDTRNHSVWFSTPGTYVVSQVSSNTLGNTTAANTYTVKAEVPLDNVTLDISCGCVGSKEVTFAYVLSEGLPPTSATVDIDYGDGTSVTGQAVTISGVGIAGAATFTHTYATTGMYYATVSSSNPVSSLSDVNVLVDVAEEITELNVTIPSATVFGDATSIDVVAASGTDVNVTCSFGDGTDDVFWSYATASLIETPINHTYAAIGDYNVTVTVTNSKLNYIKSRIVQVDQVIEQYGRTASLSIFGGMNTVNFTTTNGSRMELLWDPDVEGGDLYIYVICIYASPSVTQIDHIYPTSGVFLSRGYLSNSLGLIVDTFAMAANVLVDNFNMEGPSAVNFTNGAVAGVAYNRTSITGSQISCHVHYGDGIVQITYEDTPEEMVLYYNYTEIGVYEFKIECFNYISEVSAAWLVYVQEPMEGYSPYSDMTFATGQPLNLNLNITGGTNVSVSITYVPLRTDVNAFVTWDGQYGQLELPYPVHGYGLHDVNITIGNAVTRVENVFQVAIDDALSNVSLTTDEYVPVGTEISVTLTATTGSNACVGIDFDDGSEQEKYTTGNVTEPCTADPLRPCGDSDIDQTNCTAIGCCYDADAEPSVKCSLPDAITSSWRVDSSHTYTTSGEYKIGASVDNSVTSVFRVVSVNAQYPVQHLSIVDISMFNDYTIGIHLSADPPATDAFVEIDFADGTPNVTLTLTAVVGSDQAIEHTLAYESIFVATITIYNNISSLTLLHTLSPETPFVNASLVLLGPQQPGDEHNLTLTFSAGQSGSLYCDWGDGSPVDVYIIKSKDHIPLMNHTYEAIGSYEVKCVLNNTLSSIEFCHMADVDIDITGVTLEYAHIFLPRNPPPYIPTCYNITAVTGSRLNILLFDADDNVAYQFTNDVTDLMTPCFTYNGTQTTLIPGKLEVFNSRTLVEVFFTMALQEGLSNVTVEINKETVEFDVEAVEFTMTGGGNTANISYHLGNNYVYVTNLTEDAHNFTYMYPQDGTFLYAVNLTNYVDTFVATGTVHVEKKIYDVQGDPDFSFEIGGPLVVNFRWSGTNGQPVAYLNGVEITAVVDYANKSGNVTIPEADVQVGTQNITFNVSNHISSARTTVQVDVDAMIEDLTLSTSVMYTPVNEAFTVTGVIPNGTRFTWHLDYEDSTNDTVDDTTVVVSGEHTMEIQKTYTTHGYRYITVSVGNSLTILFRSIFIGAEFRIVEANLGVEFPTELDRPNVTGRLRIYKKVDTDPPTATVVGHDWGDGNMTSNISINLVEEEQFDAYHQYSEYFTLIEVIVSLRNNVSNVTWTLPTQVGIDIVGLNLTADSYKKHNEFIEFELHLDRGSRVIYTLDKGDGSPLVILERDDPGEWVLNDTQVTNHTYNQTGLFTVTLTANNSFGIVTVSQTVKVEYCILGTEMLPLAPIAHPPGVVEYTIRVADDQYMSPTDVSCDFNFGNGEEDRVSAVFDANKEFRHTHTYSPSTSPDHYNTTVNCFNHVCSSDYQEDVLLVEPMANIKINIINEYIEAPGLANFTMQIENGSHFTLEVDFGDGSANESIIVTHSPTTLLLSHLYQEGNYTVSVTARSVLQEQTTVSAVKFVVQNPIPDLILTSNSPVSFDTETGQFSVDVDASNTGPTDMFCNWTFSIGGDESTTYAGSVRNHITHVSEITYSYGHIGGQTVAVNCSNYISWMSYTLLIEVAEAIQGLSVDVSHTHGIVSANVISFIFTVTHGSNVTAEIVFGDGATEAAAFPDLVANQNVTTFTHTYNSPDFFKPVFRVINSLNALEAPQPAGSVEVIIEYTLVDIDVSAQNVTRYAEPVTFKATQIQTNVPSNAQIKLIYGNGVEAVASLTFSGGEYELLYYYLTDGWYNVTYQMWNNVSNLEGSFILQVGVRILNVTLSNSNRDVQAVYQPAQFIAHVDQGSEVEYILTMGNGDVTPVQKRHDDGWTTTDDTLIQHTFADPGDFTVELTARNVFDEIKVDLSYLINVENRIYTQNISHLDTHPIPDGLVTIIIENMENAPEPTDAMCVYDYGDRQSDTVNMVLAAQNRFLQVHQYKNILPGVRTISVNCSNNVSSQNYVTDLMLQEPISVQAADIVELCIRSGTIGQIWVLITNGTHVLYHIEHGDGAITERFLEYPPKVNDTVDFDHVYNVGNYTVTANLSNDISALSIVITNKFVVQNKLTLLKLTSSPTVTYPPGHLNLTVEANTYEPPTDVFCEYMFYSNQQPVQTFMADSFGIGESHIQRHTYIREKLGTHLIIVKCWNCVGSMFESKKIWADEIITGFEVAYITMFVQTSNSVKWVYSVKNGTNVDAYLTVGDIVHEKKSWPQFNASLETLQFDKTFDTAANHSLIFMVKNNVSDKTISFSPLEKLVIQDPVPAVDVTTSFPVFPRGNVQLTVTPKSGSTPGTDVFVSWESEFEDWETYAPDLGRNVAHTEDREIDIIGDILLNVVVKNKVSQYNTSVIVYIEDIITESFIELHNASVLVNEPSLFSIGTQNGSHLHFEVDFKDGSPPETFIHHNRLSGKSLTIRHVFPVRGNYSVSVTTYNNVSSETITASNEIIVQSNIKDLTVSGPHFVSVDLPDAADAVFRITAAPNLDIPQNVHLAWSVENVSLYTYADIFETDNTYELPYSFDGSVLGPVTITVNASNLVGWNEGNMTTNVLLKIKGLDLNVTSRTLAVNSVTTFRVGLETGSDITYTIGYGDGVKESCFKLDHNSICEFEHGYPSAGNYSVNVTAENSVSEEHVRLSELVIVQVAIDNQNLILITENYIPNPSGIITLTLMVIDGAPIPTDVHVTVSYGDGSAKQNVYVTAFPLTLTYTYSSDPADMQLGAKDIVVNLTNSISSDSLVNTIHLQEPIVIRAVEYPEYTPVDAPTPINVIFETGSDYDLQIKFGDGNEYNSRVNGKVGSVQVNHTYSTASLYGIKVSAKSETSYDTRGALEIEVQHPVRELQLVVDLTAKLGFGTPDQITNITLIKTPGAPIPSNTTIITDFGDGSPYLSEEKEVSPRYLYKYQYRQEGNYSATVTVMNGVSSMTFNGTVVQVETEITGCDFSIERASGEPFETAKIPVQTDAILIASTGSGSNINYKWTLEPGVSRDSSDNELTYSFQQIRFSDVQLECSNLVSQQTVVHIIEIFSPIGIHGVEFEQVVEVNTNVTFTIHLVEAIQEVCFSYHFKSLVSSITFWRGDLDVCKTDPKFDAEKYSPVEKVSSDDLEYTIVRFFTTIAEYNATFTAFNKFASISRTLPFSVRAIPCNAPTIDAKEGRTINATLRYKRAQEFAISTSDFKVVKRCKATAMYITSLQVYLYQLNNAGGAWVRQDIVNPLGEGDNVRSFFFERQMMSYGQYYLLYTLQPKGFTDNANSSKIYFRIEGTLMTTSINKVSKDVVGTMRPYRLTVSSEDPDNDPRPFGNEFYCIEKDGIWSNETAEDTIRRLDMNKELVKVPTGAPTDVAPSDQIGCWGQFPARLALDARVYFFEFNTGWMVHSKDYVFLLLVSKGERRVVGRIEIHVAEGNPPQISIECYENCKQGVRKVDNKKPFALTFFCENCPENSVPTFETSFTRNGETFEIPPDKANAKTLTLEDGRILWSQDVSDFRNPGFYELEVTIKLLGFPDGFTAFKFAINRRPYSCRIKVQAPPSSKQTEEEFIPRPWTPLVVTVVGCKDDGDMVETIDLEEEHVRRRRQIAAADTDEENHPDLKFSYAYVKKGKTIKFFSDTVLLPEGDPSEDYMIELIVVVTDNYGGETTFRELIKVQEQVYDDPEEAAAAEAEKEELIYSIITTDLSQATDVVGALSNIISAVSDTYNEPDAGSGAVAPGSEGNEDKEAAEEARLEEIKQQDRLAIVMTGLVNLATSDSSDPETIKATFEAYAVIVKQQSGAASSSMKSDSLDIAASFLENIDEQEDKEEFLNSFVDTMGDALDGALAIAPTPPAPEEDDIPSEDNDDSDDAATAAAKAAEEVKLAKKAAANLESSAKSIVDAIKVDVLLDGDPVTVGDKKLSVTIAITSLSRVNGTILTTGGSEVLFPALRPRAAEDGKEFSIFFQITYSEVNVFSWDTSAQYITDGVTMCELTDQDNNPLEFDELTEPLRIDMEQTEALDNWANMDNMTVDQQSNLIYMYVPVDVDESALIMELDINTFDDSTDLYFEVYFNFGATDAITDRPNMTVGSYNLMSEVPDRRNPLPWVIIISEAWVKLPGIYVGVIPKVRNSTKLFNQTTVPDFNMRSSLPRCRSWDMTEEIWSGKSCKVGADSSIENTRCLCGELTRAVRTYSGGLSVPKVNTIDFSKVFANFSELLAANPTVLATILVIFILYLLLLIWARRADQKDMEKWCVTPLVDNPLNCPHLYKVSVYTGLRQGAGTHSKVCFIVSGDKGDTGVRVLDDGRGKNFERATLRHFLMTSEQPLGELTFLRVWHDNSGQGPAASWFLDKIVVEDILGRTRYFFLNGRWLAVDEDDGQVDRLLPVAAHEEIDGFNHVFFSQARHNLTDDHLWISVLSRPTKSSFTRSQRLTCCLALLCTTMVANAMWYGSAGTVEQDQVIRIGPIILSVAVLLVSIFSSLTVIPINLLLVQLFRKSRPRGSTDLPDGSEVRTTETGQKDIAYMRRFSLAEKNAAAEQEEDEKKDGEEKKKSKKKQPRKYWFPWWGIVIAWVVALLASVGSLFFVLLYSLQWGKVKSEEWLSSLLLAFFQSVIIIQPFKVIIVAMMMSIVFKKFKDEEEELPLNPTTGPGSEDYDEVLHIDRKMFADVPMMPNKRKLEKARRQRELDRKLTSIMIEIMSYFFFLLLIAFIAFGSFDIQRYRHTSHLRRLLQGARKNETLQWVSDQPKMWRYLNLTVSDVLYNVRDYSDSLTTRSDRRYLKDNTNVRVGAVRLRQVRVKPALCDPPDITRGIVLECNPPYDITREQKANFSTFWLDLPVNHTDAVTELQDAFRYKGILELKSGFTIGRQSLYNGGGYVASLGTSPNKARRVLKDLMDAFWVDYYTRAVFLEFTVYNANSNLFGAVQYVFELPASGGVIPMTFVYSFSVYTVFSVMGTVVVVCQILYILILLYIIVREIRKLRKETSKVYFSNPWNIYEVIVIVTSLIGIGMYGAGEAVGRLVTKELSDDKDGHTHYERLASYTDILTVVIGVIVFLTNIRFMRLLRLNHHVVDLYHTLRDARKELMYYSVSFFIVFSAYSLPAVVFYGTWMYGHSDIFKSVSGTFNILLGRLYWNDMMIASPYITPVYFFCLVVTLYFILVNMFISILTTSYRLVRLTPDREKESEYKLMAYASAKLSSMFRCCCPTNKQPEMGKDYLDNLDSLDDRLNHINDMINNYYRENIKSKYLESKPKTMDTKGDMNDPIARKKMWADMMHF